MPAGGCRGIFGVSFGRHQPMHHTCKKGNDYAQGHSVSLPHPKRASRDLKSSSKQANLLIVGCVGFFSLLFMFSSGTGEGNLGGKFSENKQGIFWFI